MTSSPRRSADRPAARGQRVGDTLILRDTFRPNPRQIEFWEACWDPRYREILFHGAIRTGKSQAAGKIILAWAMRYGGTYLIARSTIKELEDSTIPIMLQGDGNMPPVVPEQLVDEIWWGEKKKVRLVNGAEIRFRSLEPDQRGKIRNITYAGAMIDQIEELDDDEEDPGFYEELMGRLSDPFGPRKMVAVANPGREDHWVARRFDVLREGRPADGTKHVRTTLLDNAENLDPDYVKGRLATRDTRPDYYRQMVMGEWGSFGGRRFEDVWNPQRSVYPTYFDVPAAWEIVEGADYGWVNPTHWLWVAIDFDDVWWLVHEHRWTKTKVSTISREIKEIRKGGGLPYHASLEPGVTWLDPSAWAKKSEHESIAQEFRDNGVFPAPAVNERVGGWNRLEEFLTEVMPDGYTRLRVFPHVKEFPRELRSARINMKTSNPTGADIEKTNDHALDAMRYIINSRALPPRKLTEANDEGYDRASVAARILKRAKDGRKVRTYTGEQ